MTDQQPVWIEIERLSLDESVLSLVVTHLLAREAKKSGEPENWLRDFADEVHASIDQAPTPHPKIRGHMEAARHRLDQIMSSARLRLSK
jgi:hypothetical protein